MRPPNRYGCVIDHGKCKVHDLPTINFAGCEKSTYPPDPEIGDVYENKELGESRRVLHVGEADMRRTNRASGEDVVKHVTRVCYSNGGDNNHWVDAVTFRNWMMSSRKVHDGTRRDGTGQGEVDRPADLA